MGPAQEQASDDDEETFFDSETLPTPFGVVRPGQLTSPSSSCCPSDRESLAGDYSDREEESWGGGRTPIFHPPHSPYYCPPSDGEVTPTRCPSPLPQPPLRKPREATGMRAHKGAGDEKNQQGQAEQLLREDKLKETGEEQRGHTEKDQDKAINSSKEDSQKNEETQNNEDLPKKEKMSIKEELQKKEKQIEQEEKERSIREERERDKRILKEIEERERERQVREKKRIAEEKEKERLKEENEKERLKEEKEKERLKEEMEKERLKQVREKKRIAEEK